MVGQLLQTLVFIIVMARSLSGSHPLNNTFDFVKKYEKSEVEIEIGKKHKWTRVKFRAFGSAFVLKLAPDYSTLNRFLSINVDGVLLSSTNISRLISDSVIYKGTMEGANGSSVYGKITNNSFDGFVNKDRDTFYVEPIHKYYPSTSNSESVIYRHSDIIVNKSRSSPHFISDLRRSNLTREKLHQHLLKTNPENFDTYDTERTRYGHRRKRSEISKSCSLHVVADHTFYSSVGLGSVVFTIAEIRFLIGQADIIFRSTDFNGDGYGDNIGFEISNVTIFTHQHSPGYKMSSESLDPYSYLDLFSLYHFENNCLGIVFTFRDFVDNIVGLAWTANSNMHGHAGGICQKRINVFTEGRDYSLNTAMVTVLSNERRLSSYETALVVTHELGHSFGSPHDSSDDDICSPGDEFGSYIMYPFSIDGNKPNNNKFSICSINSIYPVIVNKGDCLISRTGPYCGNGIVETDEECDCGNSAICAYTDRCCTPSDVWTSADLPCTFRRSAGKVCSAHTSPCCETDCTITKLMSRKVCGTTSECAQQSICNGTSAECPDPVLLKDGNLCDSGRKLCSNGKCTHSVCKSLNLEQCQCRGEIDSACQICCRSENTNCLVIFSITGAIQNIGTLKFTSGEPCNGSKGFCNIKGNCVTRDPDGVTKRLLKMLSKEAVHDFKLWIRDNWYYVLVGVVGFLSLIALFVASRRKSKNVQSLAYRMGRLEQIMGLANAEKNSQEEILEHIEHLYNDKIEKERNGHQRLDYTLAVARLSMFFPTAPKDTLAKLAKQSTTEDVAVRMLLMRGLPARRLIVPSTSEDEGD